MPTLKRSKYLISKTFHAYRSLHKPYIKPTLSLHKTYTKTAKNPKIATKLVTLRRTFQVTKPSWSLLASITRLRVLFEILSRISKSTLTKLRLYPNQTSEFSREFPIHP